MRRTYQTGSETCSCQSCFKMVKTTVDHCNGPSPIKLTMGHDGPSIRGSVAKMVEFNPLFWSPMGGCKTNGMWKTNGFLCGRSNPQHFLCFFQTNPVWCLNNDLMGVYGWFHGMSLGDKGGRIGYLWIFPRFAPSSTFIVFLSTQN